MSPARSPIGVDQCHCFAMRKAARQISRLYDSHLQPTGLRITQFLILAALNQEQGVSINDLAERLDTERTAMGKMVGVLERDGFVRLRPSPTDGRSRLVELTPDGKDLFEQAAPLWREAQRQFSDMNGAKDVRALRQGLSGMKTGDLATSSFE
ncbi:MULTISPECIES: MarR family winged helix-turn-helix transcriptional regulator [unclassified Dyella]|uniref:MarR family winged helix-turn-helix transcriptional regulator n=1 Tax=unclassified Dyella TaxID=2634549 RepID=UPI003F9069DC